MSGVVAVGGGELRGVGGGVGWCGDPVARELFDAGGRGGVGWGR